MGRLPRKRVRVIVAGVAAVVMGDWVAGMLAAPMLDLDVLAVALPPAEVAWAGTVNTVAVAALLAVAGRLADLAGRRGVLAVGLALYVLGASAVIVAPSWPVLVGARLGQGAGVALMVPAALALLLAAVPERRRPGGVALWTAACAAGALATHAGAGWLLAMFGWRGLFLPGAAVAAVLLLFVPALPRSLGTSGPGSGARGPVGAVVFVAGITTAVLTLARGGVWGWTSGLTLGCAGAAALLLTMAAILTRRPASAPSPSGPPSPRDVDAPVLHDTRRGAGRADGLPGTPGHAPQDPGWAHHLSGTTTHAPQDPGRADAHRDHLAGVRGSRSGRGRAPGRGQTGVPGIGWPGVVAGAGGAVFFALLTTAAVRGVDAGVVWVWLTGMIVAAPATVWAGRRYGTDAVVLGGALALGSGCALLLAPPYPPVGIIAGALAAGAGLGALATGALTIGTAPPGRGNLAARVGAVDTARVAGAAAGTAGAAILTTGGTDAVLLACLTVAALLAATATWRVAAARRTAQISLRTAQNSLRVAQQEVESLRGLLLELRASFTEVRGQADRELVRLGCQDVPAPWVNPHGQE